MALVKYGAIISEARGKEAGIVFSRNSYGGYMKQKVSPINPQTSYQQMVRGQLGTIAQQWSGLAEQIKEAWKQLGQQVLRVNRFGDQTYYTGFNLFVKLNRNRVIMGLPIITTPPALPSLPTLNITGVTIEQTSGNVETVSIAFTLTGGDAPSDFQLAVDATPAVLTGRRFVKNFYRQLGSYPAETSPANVTTAYQNRFGMAMPDGAYVGVRLRLIDEQSGFDSAYYVKGTLAVEV